MIENEFKIKLSAEQYEKLLAEYSWDETFSQTNHYYDNDALELSERGITCRVREVGGNFFLQMKLPSDKVFSRMEIEKQMNKLPETLSGNGLCGFSGERELPDVKRIGSLTTLRSVKRFEGAEIDLDKSEYFGKTDYEAEIEFTDEAKARELLAKITELVGASPASEVCRGKIRRFLDEYRKTLG